MAVSEPINAKALAFLSTPPGWFGDWHRAPVRQFVVVVTGTLEVEVSAGEVRRFDAGNVILAADVKGKGHISRNVGKDTLVIALVPVVRSE